MKFQVAFKKVNIWNKYAYALCILCSMHLKLKANKIDNNNSIY